MLRVLDLFSGIGGFSLGLERTGGFKTVAFCEIEPFPQAVLRKHWPEVPIYDDVRTLTAERLKTDGIAVDVICGGFPCQDASVANPEGGGSSGSRTGLFQEAVKLAGELRAPLIMENVTGLLDRGFGDVLAALARIGFDAQWDCLQAAALGLPHGRDRLWIIAYPHGSKLDGLDIQKSLRSHSKESRRRKLARAVDAALPADDYARMRTDYDGLPAVMAELKAYGNSIVPCIMEAIGQAILEAEGIVI